LAAVPTADRVEIVAILSLATDLAMGQKLGFGLRSCLASLQLARACGFSDADRRETYYHALLRHAGCTAQTDTLTALFGDEIALRQTIAATDLNDTAELLPLLLGRIASANGGRNPLALIGAMIAGALSSRKVSSEVFKGQCEAAGRLAQRLDLPAAVSRNLTQIYERWDGKGLPRGLAGEAIPAPVRVVNLVQEAMTLAALLPSPEALRIVEQRSGHAYDPKLAAALLNDPTLLAAPDDDAVLWERVIAAAPDHDSFEGEALDAAVAVLADFIDLRAPAIAGHSRAVAALAREAAARAGLPDADRAALYRAGLVHDLGYTAVPAQLRLDDPGSGEQARLHPYYGERLLGWSATLAPLGRIVAEHHERLDGSGFHRGAGASDLSMAGRILAAAEAYQSLVEDRPFRVTLSGVQAAARLRGEAQHGTLDAAAVAAVLDASGRIGRARKPALPAGLTTREVEILRRIAVGAPVKAIAREFGISPKTVGNHVQNVYAKIEVSTRAGATLFAIEQGLLRPGTKT
jgi:HD-GYP domain-containing protein (c-di-GMP phosphodiesterase class II)